ncbi:MAG: MarR family transcriptional regulator [Clostridia bacterium]|nr:MarR family transcriptional regulator [Clostridia bacterium]
MIQEEELMKLVTRTAAYIRRRPRNGQESNGERGEHPRCAKGHGHILDLLSESDGMSQQEIANRMDIRPQSVSEAIASMEYRGFVIRRPSPDDKRVSLIFITAAGKEHRKQVKEERRAFAKQFFGVLSEKEKEQLAILLEALLQGQSEDASAWAKKEESI